MSAYEVLYQKYRPKNLDQVCGQEHIVKTLRNSIKENRIANAYLFTVIHGTGKTTISRILSCMLNCDNGPTENPCGECPNCKKIIAGKASDVLEVDAASNRGIDNIRALRDKARYAPSEMRSKIFIIDEAHQLTNEASNALLKILEEPPKNLHFCLCTTEPRAIIGTIKSRCQHFAVKVIPQQKLFEYLVPIIKKENLKIDKDALKMIVKIAGGSMRNALRSLESVWNYSGNEKITTQAVSEVLGVSDTKKIFELIDLSIKRDTTGGIKLINDMAVNGMDLSSFLIDFTSHIRNVLLLNTSEDTSVVDATEEEISHLKEQSRSINIAKSLRIFNILEEACRGSNLNLQAQSVLEVCFLRAVTIIHEQRT